MHSLHFIADRQSLLEPLCRWPPLRFFTSKGCMRAISLPGLSSDIWIYFFLGEDLAWKAAVSSPPSAFGCHLRTNQSRHLTSLGAQKSQKALVTAVQAATDRLRWAERRMKQHVLVAQFPALSQQTPRADKRFLKCVTAPYYATSSHSASLAYSSSRLAARRLQYQYPPSWIIATRRYAVASSDTGIQIHRKTLGVQKTDPDSHSTTYTGQSCQTEDKSRPLRVLVAKPPKPSRTLLPTTLLVVYSGIILHSLRLP